MTLIAETSGHKFIVPKKTELKITKEIEIFQERQKRIINAFKRIRLSYDPQDYSSKKQLANEKISCHLQAEHPDLTSRQLLQITRVKLPVPGLFEDQDGNIDNSVKSALVYRVTVNIQREDAAKAGIYDDYIDSCTFVIGRYEAPNPKYTFNDRHEITNSRVVGQTRRYYIADNKKNIEDIIKRFGGVFYKIHPFTVAIASHSGSMYYHNNKVYTIFDKDDWITSDIDLLIGANQAGFLEADKKGRIELYEQFTKKQEQRRKAGENISPKKFIKDLDKQDEE